MILGLDVSTSITGVTVLDYDENVFVCEAWDLRNKKHYKDIFDKSNAVNANFLDLRLKYDIKQIYIEKPFMFFNSGGSSAKTMSILQNFNGIVSWLAFQQFGIKPEYLTASQARKLCGIKLPKGAKAKEKVIEFVLDKEPNFSIQYTKFGNPKPGESDRADSWVIAMAGLCECREKNLKS